MPPDRKRPGLGAVCTRASAREQFPLLRRTGSRQSKVEVLVRITEGTSVEYRGGITRATTLWSSERSSSYASGIGSGSSAILSTVGAHMTTKKTRADNAGSHEECFSIVRIWS